MFTEAEAGRVSLTATDVKGGDMPQIVVTADRRTEDGQPAIMFRERVSATDFESKHFAAQLVERIGWAVADAEEVDERPTRSGTRGAERDELRERAIDAVQRELALSGRGSASAS